MLKQNGKYWPILPPDELQRQVLDKFELPEPLVYEIGVEVGPDDVLYYLHGFETNKNYLVRCRDYMSELKYEKNSLRNDYRIKVERWLRPKDADDDADWWSIWSSGDYAVAEWTDMGPNKDPSSCLRGEGSIALW